MRKYEKYKDSGGQWIGKIPEHWDKCKLKNYLSGLQDGTHGSHERVPSEYPLLSAKNIFDYGLEISNNESTISKNDNDSIIANGYPQNGDIALCCVGTIGRCCIYKLDKRYAFQRSVSFLRCNSKSSNRYLLYLLKSNVCLPQYDMYAKTSAQSGIYMGALASFEIIKPSLSEQESIASYLDSKVGEIDNMIEKTEKKIELYEELKKSIITHAVTKGLNPNARMKNSGVDWIGKIPENWNGCRFKNFLSLKTTTSKSKIKIGLENIESKTGHYIETITEFEGNGVEFMSGDIVYGKLRPYLQKVWLAEFEGNAVGDFFVFKARNNANATYIKYLLLSDGFTKEADGSTYGAKMPRVSSNFILCLQYYLPPLPEQQVIASYLDSKTNAIDSQISIAHKRIDLLKELKSSLITNVVTGKIKVAPLSDKEYKAQMGDKI